MQDDEKHHRPNTDEMRDRCTRNQSCASLADNEWPCSSLCPQTTSLWQRFCVVGEFRVRSSFWIYNTFQYRDLRSFNEDQHQASPIYTEITSKNRKTPFDVSAILFRCDILSMLSATPKINIFDAPKSGDTVHYQKAKALSREEEP